MAALYHFDGFFINQESVPDSRSRQIIPLIKAIRTLNPNFLINFYQDDNTPQATMLMANGTQLASRYFVNYGWQGSVSSWVSLADAVGYPRSSLEFGINLESPGQFTGSGQKTSFEETSKEGVSLALYDYPKILSHAENVTLTEAYYRNRNYFFGNVTRNWPGVINYSRNCITSVAMPFITDFSLGAGNLFFSDGTVILNKPWMNMALQSTLPTEQFATTPSSQKYIEASFDFELGYNYGSSLSFRGISGHEDITFDLFQTRLTLQSKQRYVLRVVHINRRSQAALLCLEIDYGLEKICHGLQKNTYAWTTDEFMLTNLSERTVTNISLFFKQQTQPEAWSYLSDKST